MTTPDQPTTADIADELLRRAGETETWLLGRAALIKLQALHLAASHRREAFIIGRKEDPEGEYDGAVGRQVLADARIYHAWLTDAQPDPAGSAT